jgi:hypothetical protein
MIIECTPTKGDLFNYTFYIGGASPENKSYHGIASVRQFFVRYFDK